MQKYYRGTKSRAEQGKMQYNELMELEPKPIQNEIEYKEFVERYCYLVDGELKNAESLQTENGHHDLALLVPKLISIVNVAGYLRGQDNRFIDLRPHVSFQSALHKKEDEYEKRLSALIELVKSSDSAEFLSDRIQEYYLKHRDL